MSKRHVSDFVYAIPIFTLYTSNGLTYQVFDCPVFTIQIVATLDDTAPAGATHRQSYETTQPLERWVRRVEAVIKTLILKAHAPV
jgi:hypothetical protein